MMVQTKAKRISLSRTHRIPAPQPRIGTGLIGLGVEGHHLAGTALSSIRRSRRASYQKTHYGHANKAPRLGRSCYITLMCALQAKTIKQIYSRSVCDHGDLVRGSSASFQDVALVTAGTRKALSQTTQRKQTRPAANPRSDPKQTMTSTRSSDTLLSELQQIASEVIDKDVSVDAPLMDAGLDSIGATELSNKISAHLNTELSPTLLFDHPSLRSIADALSADSGSVPAQEFEHEQEAPVLPTAVHEATKRATSGTSRTDVQSTASIIKSIQTTL